MSETSNNTEIVISDTISNVPTTRLLKPTFVNCPNAVIELRNMRDKLTEMRDQMTEEWRAEDQETRRWNNHPMHYDFESIVNSISHLMGKLL